MSDCYLCHQPIMSPTIAVQVRIQGTHESCHESCYEVMHEAWVDAQHEEEEAAYARGQIDWGELLDTDGG